MQKIFSQIATELNAGLNQVTAAVSLLDDGATVPFISRYRKEVTGGLDDGQLRTLEDRLRYLRELEERRGAILKSIDEQGKLTPELNRDIQSAVTKTELEDLYLPYKPKRRTKAQIAIEAGLLPLADLLLEDPTRTPEQEAEAFLNTEHNINDVKSALEGARFILMERFAEDAHLLAKLRDFLNREGLLTSAIVSGKESEGEKFRDYFEYSEKINKVPSHRALAVFRGRNEGILQINLTLDGDEPGQPSACEGIVADHFNILNQGRPGDKFLAEVVRWTWKVKLLTHMETELFGQLREQAENEAINVFAKNLKDLLLAAPAGPKATIGLDPGLRTGVKVAVVDATGKVLDHGAIFPNPPQNKIKESEKILAALCQKYNVELIAIGNGTASRETDRFVAGMFKQYPDLNVQKVVVNESGASVYSASEFAAREFPDLDVTIRGAISIARRLQDPLAELVKIDPKSIGVGQYQHDVSQVALSRQLDAVVEDCVNAVGVDLNTASAPLLSRVSGLTASMASNVVEYRQNNGGFKNRKELLKVTRLGPKAFEQAAGFLRITNGDNPLDQSGVHPESYEVVNTIVAKLQKPVTAIIGDHKTLRALNAEEFTSEQFGLPTVKDILSELEKPGRDPRPEFKTAVFQEGVEELKDLRPGMILEGTVTNVTNFGAFVDVGVHQDGLVHISAMSHQFIDNPAKVVKAGDIVKVKIMEVDVARKRIGMSMRLDDQPGEEKSENKPGNRNSGKGRQSQPAPSNTMAALFAKAQNKQKKRL
ncbi:Tex family protein [Gynuella sp.]|uniref:Tex family protein n=1 Tax=Gynuella sp. TaxID=2969146 RepID=UPI003D13CF7C